MAGSKKLYVCSQFNYLFQPFYKIANNSVHLKTLVLALFYRLIHQSTGVNGLAGTNEYAVFK
jgi:hypothetical protein